MAKSASEPVERRFAENLRLIREQLGLSQNDLASRMRDLGFSGVYQTTISRLEKGERPVRLSEALALSTALGHSLDVLLAPSVSVGLLHHVSSRADVLRAAGNDWISRTRELLRIRAALQEAIAEAADGGIEADPSAEGGSLEQHLALAQRLLQLTRPELLLEVAADQRDGASADDQIATAVQTWERLNEDRMLWEVALEQGEKEGNVQHPEA